MRKVVCTADNERLWLEQRHKRVTGSDAAILLGLAQYPKNLSNEEKLANLKHTKKVLSVEEANAAFEIDAAKNMRVIRYGRIYEVLETYINATLLGATDLWGTHAFLENPSLPGLGATLDALVSFDGTTPPADIPVTSGGLSEAFLKEARRHTWDELSTFPHLDEIPEGVGLWEQKTTGQWGMKTWRDGVPGYYMAQVQLQLAVTDLPWAVICCVGDRDRAAYLVYPDVIMQEQLKRAAKEFWK